MEAVKLTPQQFQQAKRAYEEAVKERARQVKVMREELGWSFEKIGEHFQISKQAAANIYKNFRDVDE
jgi:predicted component of type VI protein secretion system